MTATIQPSLDCMCSHSYTCCEHRSLEKSQLYALWIDACHVWQEALVHQTGTTERNALHDVCSVLYSKCH